MAYVSKEDKVVLSVGVKAVLAKYKMKGTISIKHMSSLVVKINKGELDLLGAYKQGVINNCSEHYMPNKIDLYNKYDVAMANRNLEKTYFDVNGYWVNEHYDHAPIIRDFYLELIAAMEGKDFFNHDDGMTDYFHRSHYIDICIGAGKNGYECTTEVQTFEPIELMVA